MTNSRTDCALDEARVIWFWRDQLLQSENCAHQSSSPGTGSGTVGLRLPFADCCGRYLRSGHNDSFKANFLVLTMVLPAHETAKVDKFFTAIAPLLPAYRHQSVGYLAVRAEGGVYLLHLVLRLSALPLAPNPEPYRTAHVLCAEIPLSETTYSPRALIDALASGTVTLAGEACRFPSEAAGNHGAHAWPIDGTVAGTAEQLGRLTIQGNSRRYILVQDLDYQREVRADRISYDSLSALGAAFGLEFQENMSFCADLIVSPVAKVTGFTRQTDCDAMLTLWLSGELSLDLCAISVRTAITVDGKTRPLDVPTATIWERDTGGDWRGSLSVTLPKADLTVSAVASYAGFIQEEKRFAPPVEARNNLLAALQPFDETGAAFADVLANRKIKNRDPQELEQTVAAILAIRGFRVITADRIPNLGEIPDIVAADADGNILVVECTLNLPKYDDKLGKLHRRREAIRLAFADNKDIEVLGVLAVPQPEHVLQPFQEEAGKHQLVFWNQQYLQALAADDGPENSRDIFGEVRGAIGTLANP